MQIIWQAQDDQHFNYQTNFGTPAVKRMKSPRLFNR